MKQSFSKTFLSALAGSILLVVALFVMNNMQPQNQVVQAATAVQAPALAETGLTTVTLTSSPVVYTKDFTLTIVRKDASASMTAAVFVGEDENMYGEIWTLAAGAVTSTKSFKNTLYPGTYDVAAFLYVGDKYIGYVETSVKVMPVFQFDSAVPSEMMLGDCLSATVKVQPAINYMSNTKEVVAYDFGNGDKVKEVVVGKTSSYTKSDKLYLDSTYVYTEYCGLVQGSTYNVKATYKSDLYGATAGEVVKTVKVNNPTIKVWATEVGKTTPITTAKAGDTVRVWAETSKAISPTVLAIANGRTLVHQEAMTATQTKIYTDITVPDVDVATPMTITGVLASDKYGFTNVYEPVAGLKATKIVTEGYTTVMAEPSGAKVAKVDLTAEPASPIAAGKTYTLTAKLTDKAGQVVTDTAVMFMVTNTDTGDLVSDESENSDDAGEAVYTLTSDEPVTYTVVAVSEGVTSTQELTLQFESGEIVERYDPTKETTLTSEDGLVIITIPTGAYTEPMDIVFEDVDEPTESTKLKAINKFGFFSIRFYRIVDGQRGAEIVPPPTPLKAIKIEYKRLTIDNATLLQQSRQVPISDTQLLKISTYTGPSWSNIPSTVTTTGSDLAITGETMAPGNPYGVITANNEVYLPKVNKP